jgi:catechol 2,3-dioxygenase-like lactoylglutathione lyase family enzyme
MSIENRRRLGGIRAVTYSVPDIAAIERAYGGVLDYRVVDRGTVAADRAAFWGAPAAAGRRYVALEPAGGEAVALRFVETPHREPWRALTTHGWNATEIIVEDVNLLAERIADSPFRRIGGPRPLTNYPKISAMQVIGPAGECVYLTHAPPGCGMDLGPARGFVGRVFSVVAGGPDIHAMNAAYAASFDNVVRPPKPTPIGIINEANGLPADHKTDLGLVELEWGTVLELDGYAPAMTPRPTRDGDLPPGMAIVTLDVRAVGAGYTPDAHKPLSLSAGPDAGLRMWRGAAGELIELAA